MSAVPADAPARPPFPTRFGWGMRLFLALILFDMAFRGFSVTYPWGDWADELGMRTMPIRLPTRAEWAELPSQATEDNPHPLREEICRSLDSAWDYLKPWPGPAERAKVRTWADGGKWALAWLSSRLEFAENLVGFNEEWPMFSPSVSTNKQVARARLAYADSTERVVRGLCDPEDLTRYSHWFEEKVLDHELKVCEGGEAKARDNRGYCNLLAHRYPRGDAGAPLTTIHLFMVRYDLVPPHADARAWLRAQTGPPKGQVLADFYRYDVAAREGTILLRSYKTKHE
ncbi:MAG: hypothetical protein U0797_21515 [Gemmataceae bacterium]